MQYVIEDLRYRFLTAFDTETGGYMRTGILDEQGRDTGIDPFMASFPHLIDVGVMGHCDHGKSGLCTQAGIGCYQSGLLMSQPNMDVEDFAWIARQCEGRCTQFALGGRGDPDQHEHFEDLLRISRDNQIVPNFTTSGYGLTPELAKICARYCGAVAVSWYRSSYTERAINLLLAAGVTTNIHYVLGKHSIDEAIARLEGNDFPDGIAAVVFLLHKPVGQGSQTDVLEASDPRVAAFFAQVERPHPFGVGLDACSLPGALNCCTQIDLASLDTCEAARFSCYIGPDLKMTPCSFDADGHFAIQLGDSMTIADGHFAIQLGDIMTIADGWDSEPFEHFRNTLRTACPDCARKDLCLGGCPLKPEIVLCDRQAKTDKP